MQQWSDLALDNIVSAAQAAYKHIQNRDRAQATNTQQCTEALLAYGEAMGVDMRGPSPPLLPADSCAERMWTFWRFNDTTLPSEASVDGWCKGCAGPIRTALSRVAVVGYMCKVRAGFMGVRVDCTSDHVTN